jgi:hypothetical protein
MLEILSWRQKSAVLLCGLVTLAGTISQAYCAWYARFENASKISECAFWDESVDISWDKLNKRFGSCELVTKDGSGAVGFVFQCGANNTQFLFRSQEDCEYSKVTMNAGERINKSVFATDGTKNSDLWAAVMDSCFTRMKTQGMVKSVGLQRSDDYCVCASDSLGQYSSEDLESKKLKGLSDTAVKTCAQLLGANSGTFLSGSKNSKEVKAFIDVLMHQLKKPMAHAHDSVR